MRVYKNICIFFIFINLLVAKEALTWYIVPIPPFFITEGNDKNKGIHDLMLSHYIKNLSMYDHRFEIVSINRLLEVSKKGDNFGTMILLKTEEREKNLYFSDPYDFILSNHIIIAKDKYNSFIPYIDEEGFIDLKKILMEKNFTLGIEAGRIYHNSFKELINKSTKVDKTFGINSSELLLKKLSSNRINAMIEYPEVVQYIIKSKKIKLDYIAIPIKGIEPYNLVRFSFPKTEWGEKMINTVNEEISNYTKTKEYENLTLKLSPTKSKYLKEFRKTIIKN